MSAVRGSLFTSPILRLASGLVGGFAVTVGGAACLGWADNVSHHHPVNHVLEAPLIVGGILLLLVGTAGIACVILAEAFDA